MLGTLITTAVLVTASLAFDLATASSQTPPVATFKSSVDLVRISAVVRDRKGRFVQDL